MENENNTTPCQYRIEELKNGIPKFLEDIRNGNTVPHENIGKKYESPCQYSIQELQADAAQFTEEFKSGQAKFISHEEIKRKWLQ